MGEGRAMRELNLLKNYPQPEERVIPNRTIENRILASYRGRDFFDGPRECGYGGMVYDGRWEAVAADIIAEYNPRRVIQIQCERGFLLHELSLKHITCVGIESSTSARRTAMRGDMRLDQGNYDLLPGLTGDFFANPFDLAIALGVIYTLPLDQAMNLIRQIERMALRAFITLAAYETEEDLRLFRKWTLLGTTILKKEEWIEVLKHCGFTGDYWFVTAQSLRLREI